MFTVSQTYFEDSESVLQYWHMKECRSLKHSTRKRVRF